MAQEDPPITPLTATEERPPDEAPARPNRDVFDVVGEHGGLYPRWPLLAALFFMPCVVIGYGLEIYFNVYSPYPCPFGGLCQLDTLPGAAQVLLLFAAFGLLWLVVFLVGIDSIENRRSDAGGLARLLRDASNVEPVRGLLLAYGGLTLLGMVVALLRGALYPALFVLSGIPMLIALTLLIRMIWRGGRGAEQRQLTAQEREQNEARRARNPLYVFRNLPGVNRIWPTRVPHT